MLSLFPELLFLAPFSALILRAVLVFFLCKASYKHFSRTTEFFVRTIASIEIAASILLFLGAYAQVGALAGLALTVLWLLIPRIRPFPQSTVVLLMIMSFSILITGPGALAFDIPI